MPLPVITDVWQVRLVWTAANAPRPATTQFHVHDDLSTGLASAVWATLDADVLAGMWDLVGGSAKVSSVVLTPLDGVSASSTFTPAAVAKWAAGSAGELMPQGAAVISLKSAKRGPKYRNRLYLPFIAEGSQANGTLTGAQVTTTQTAWDAFAADMATDDFPLVVVSPTDQADEPLTGIVARPYLKTQRRRARR